VTAVPFNDPSGALPGPVTKYVYHGEGQVLDKETTATGGSLAVTAYLYDSRGNLLSTTLPASNDPAGSVQPVTTATSAEKGISPIDYLDLSPLSHLGLQSTLRARGRPKKASVAEY
jgi:YD repeat-containing protein